MFLSNKNSTSFNLLYLGVFALLLSGCGGGDRFTTETTNETTTESTATLNLGTGTGAGFLAGTLSTDIPAGTSLSFGGDSVISVNVVDTADNSLYTDDSVNVNFTSNCVESGDASVTDPVITASGVAEATYSASTCEGPDIITATLEDGTSASANITVADQSIGTLEFVAANPSTIALSGGGSSANPDFSEVSFIVRDDFGQAVPNETVNFTLSTSIGGISLSSASAITDSDGLASVTLNAGSVNSSVTITASVDDGASGTIATASNPISIVGGLPDQNSFTLGASVINPGGWDVNGLTSTITVRASDRFNNDAPDGTQIAFVTDGGSITGSCSLFEGSCSVTWTSQNPRTGDVDADGSCDAGASVECGFVHILARTTGEESFTDTNGNGQFDIGEPILQDLDEAFNDENDNGSYDTGEFFSDFNVNGAFDVKPNTLFQGSNCSDAAAAAGHCANLVDVRRSITLCMSSDETVTRVYNDTGTETPGLALAVTAGTEEIATFLVSFEDINGNTPPNGTTISISADNGSLVSGTSIVIPNRCRKEGSTQYPIQIRGDTVSSVGTIIVEVTQRDGLVRQTLLTFSD